jgi:Predicted dehydrogenases and related proteins
MSETDRLGIGFVGAGFITRTFHSDALGKIRHADAAGIMNPTVSKADSLAEEMRAADCGDPNTYGDVRELIQDPAVDALWITSPNYARVETMEMVADELEQGNTDLVGIAFEKPLGRNLKEAQRVVELVEQTGLAHAYLENQVHMPSVTRLKELLWSNGRPAGRPYLARSTEEHSGPHAGWFWDGKQQGGGVLNDMMCHSHKVNRFLLEDPDTDGGGLTPLAVAADISTLKWGRDEYAQELADEYGVDYENTPAEDYARGSIFYETEDGQLVVGEATNSWNFVGSGIRLTMELLGPEYSGSVNTIDTGTEVFFSDNIGGDGEYYLEKQEAEQGAIPVVPDETAAYGYLEQNKHVVESFRAGENAREDVHDGLAVVRLCMGSYKAAEEGRRLEFDSVDLEEYVPEPARGEFDSGPAGVRTD